MSKIQKGESGFTSYYSEQYKDDWKTLLKYLKRPTRHAMIYNFRTKGTEVDLELRSLMNKAIESTQSKQSEGEELIKYYSVGTWLSNYWEHVLGPEKIKVKGVEVDDEKNLSFPQPQVTGEEELLSHYCLDAASLLPIIALQLDGNDKVLDLCSAPGGKSFVIGQLLFKDRYDLPTEGNSIQRKGSLHCNEVNKIRYERLKHTMLSYYGKQALSPPLTTGEIDQDLEPMIKVTNLDGTMYGHFGTKKYNKILVDAPCSSERHLIHQNQLKTFDKKYTEQQAAHQLKLLLSAIQMLDFNGKLVYSTCSLSYLENDGVIEQILKRRGDIVKNFEFIPNDNWGQKTKYGWICLPHQTSGWGPIYIAVLERIGEDKVE